MFFGNQRKIPCRHPFQQPLVFFRFRDFVTGSQHQILALLRQVSELCYLHQRWHRFETVAHIVDDDLVRRTKEYFHHVVVRHVGRCQIHHRIRIYICELASGVPQRLHPHPIQLVRKALTFLFSPPYNRSPSHSTLTDGQPPRYGRRLSVSPIVSTASLTVSYSSPEASRVAWAGSCRVPSTVSNRE